MTERARELLDAFDTLSLAEQSEVAKEIVRRATASGGLSDEALTGLADELFRAYDDEEASGAARVQPG